MSSLLRFVHASYALLVRRYPARFQEDFRDEMETVFRDLVAETAKQGLIPLLEAWLRELVSLPLNILAETLHEFKTREVVMALGVETSSEARLPASWGKAFLAGLPHLIFAALITLAPLLTDARSAKFVAWSLVLLIVACFMTAMFLTWRRHSPAWGASWFGYGGLLVFVFAILPSQGWNPPISWIIRAAGSLLLLTLTLLTLLYWLTRRDPVEGLLLGFPVAIIYWLPLTEFIPNSISSWLIASLFLVCALGAALVLRKNSVSWGIYILLVASATGGLPLAFARTYLNTIPAEYSEPASLFQFVGLFSPQFLAGAALVLGPLFGWGVWRLGRMHGSVGRLSAGLLILGMVVNLFGLFSYWRWFDHLDYFDALGLPFLYKPGGAFSFFLIYAGLIGIVVGGFCLGALIWRKAPFLSLSIGISTLALPHFAMFPVYSGFHILMPGFPLALNALTPLYKSAVFGWAILILLLAAWTVSRLHSGPPLPEGEE